MQHKNGNIRITRGVRSLLLFTVEHWGPDSRPGKRAMTILSSGQTVMRRTEYNRFERELAASNT